MSGDLSVVRAPRPELKKRGTHPVSRCTYKTREALLFPSTFRMGVGVGISLKSPRIPCRFQIRTPRSLLVSVAAQGSVAGPYGRAPFGSEWV